MLNDRATANAINDADMAASLQALYRHAGGNVDAAPDAMLRRIVDDASNLLRLAAFPPDFESIALSLLRLQDARIDAELRIDLLALACEAGYADLASALLQGRIAWRDGDRFQSMALAIAARHPPLVRLLLAAGIDARTRSACGASLLSLAIDAGDAGIVQMLRDAGARADREGQALAAAAIGGDPDMIRMCLLDGASDAALAAALDLAATARQYPAMVMLLQAGAPVDPAISHMERTGDTEAIDLLHAGLAARLLASGVVAARNT